MTNLGAPEDWLDQLEAACLDSAPVTGLTHKFYRYPARFSPRFARTAIELFSKPGDMVMDPYMGGGTTVVEAVAAGREVVGVDLNTLAVFVTRVKTQPLSDVDIASIARWADKVVPKLNYRSTPKSVRLLLEDPRTTNMSEPRARSIKKLMALAIGTLKALPSQEARAFGRCVLLNVGQLALNSRRRHMPLPEVRERLSRTAHEMLAGLADFQLASAGRLPVALLNSSAADLHEQEPLRSGRKVRLVVTSPPYPGVHMLYHRWLVGGRRESPAPYWLTSCRDGAGAAYYTFADRQVRGDGYFKESLRTLKAIRKVMADDGVMVQLVAFGQPELHLPRYLENMRLAGFEEHVDPDARVWRDVPRRSWHANSKGRSGGSREVVLVHRPI